MYGELGLGPGVDVVGSIGVMRVVSWGGVVCMCICRWCYRVYCSVCVRLHVSGSILSDAARCTRWYRSSIGLRKRAFNSWSTMSAITG